MFNAQGIKEAIDFFQGTAKEIKRAGRNAVRSTATMARKSAIKKISSETGLDKKLVSDSILVKENRNEENAQVLAKTKRISLEKYSPSIIYRLTQGTVHADISMLRSNQVIRNRVFSNPVSGKIWKRKGAKALPISRASGPSVSHHFDRINEEIINEANETLVKLFWDRLEKQIKKRK